MKKEFLSDISLPDLDTPVRQVGKFYIRAKKFGKKQLEINRSTEGVYHRILESVKNLYRQLPNEADRTVFEMNRKSDFNSVSGMHDFLAPGFYWNLECDIWGKCTIHYAFSNCPFEQEIRRLFDHCALHNYLQGKDIKDLGEYYRKVMECQPLKFVTVLNQENS